MKKLYLIITAILFLTSGSSLKAEPNFNYRVETTQSYNIKPDGEKEKILFILDLSNSMNENIGEGTKLQIALETLNRLLPQLPPTTEVGLRVYGHRVGLTYLDGCTASKLMVPIAPNNSGNIAAALSKVRAVGWTPITYSLKHAVNSDFAGYGGKKRIILLTDGGENCDESPCTWSIELMRTRNDIFIDVIAFDIGDYDAQAQLKCTALTTSGKYYTAKDAQELQNSLFESLNINKNVRGKIKINP